MRKVQPQPSLQRSKGAACVYLLSTHWFACNQPICKLNELKIEQVIYIVSIDSDLKIIIVPAMKEVIHLFFYFSEHQTNVHELPWTDKILSLKI